MSTPLITASAAAPDRLQTFYAFLPATGRYHAFRGIPTMPPESWWPAPHRGFPSCANRDDAEYALRCGLGDEARAS